MKNKEKAVREAVMKCANGRGNGILVQVFGGEVSFFSRICHEEEDEYGFTALSGRFPWNTRTSGLEEFIARLCDEDTEYYYFASLCDFAKAAIQNGWRLES